jgi:hypothetical protein
MGFSGIDDLTQEITSNGKFYKLPFNRTIDTGATSAAGRWHTLLTAGGTGGAFTMTGTAGTGIAFNSSTVGALPINAAVATDTRHLLSMLANTSTATAVPAMVMLTDIIHIYPSCVLTGTPSTMSNHPTWTGTGDTRMTSAVGVQCSLMVTTATTAGNGQITATYLDQGGNSGTAGALYAPSATTPTGALYGATNTAVSLGGPFMPLAAGDTGVQRISSYAINTGATSGVGAFILHKPIASIPLAALNTPSERSFMSDPFLLPRVYDDSCLAMFIQVGGALVAGGIVTGELNFGWG